MRALTSRQLGTSHLLIFAHWDFGGSAKHSLLKANWMGVWLTLYSSRMFRLRHLRCAVRSLEARKRFRRLTPQLVETLLSAHTIYTSLTARYRETSRVDLAQRLEGLHCLLQPHCASRLFGYLVRFRSRDDSQARQLFEPWLAQPPRTFECSSGIHFTYRAMGPLEQVRQL